MPSGSLTVPNSGTLSGPFSENSARVALETPTWLIATATRSGRSVRNRPTMMPPAEPPSTAILPLAV